MGRGRAPCCEKIGLNKGTWTEEEDMKLIAYIKKYGHQNWRALPRLAGLLRCGKSCRLRWINYLRPDIKRGNFTKEEEETIIKLHTLLGNKWSKIASCLPGRTDNEIKNVWNTHLKKRVPSREQQPMANKTEEAPSTCTSSTSRSCSDQGEGKSKSECSDRLVQLIEIPIDPSIDMFGILEDGLPTLMQKGEMEDKNMLGTYLETVSPCSSASVFLETNQNDAKQGDQMLNGVDQEENYYNLSISDVLSEPEIWKIFEDGDSHSLCQWLEPETHRVPMKMEGETDADGKSKEWLDYLEKELGLDGAAGEDDRKSLARDAVEELDPWDEMDGDPVSSYFQTGNFSLPPLQILPSGINCSNPKVCFD